jgi:protease-4
MPATDDPDWERALINKMAAEFLREQRRSRRWGVIFKVGILLYLLLLVGAYYATAWRLAGTGEHTALIEVEGVIAPGPTPAPIGW